MASKMCFQNSAISRFAGFSSFSLLPSSQLPLMNKNKRIKINSISSLLRESLLCTLLLYCFLSSYTMLDAQIAPPPLHPRPPAYGVGDLRCANVAYPAASFRHQPDTSKVYMRLDEIENRYFQRARLTKYASVFGIRILGGETVSDAKILHVASILAELLDSKQAGEPRSEALLRIMRQKYATLAIAESSEVINDIFNSLPKAYECVFYLVVESQDEIIPGAPTEPDCPTEYEQFLSNTQSNRYKYDKTIGLASDFVIQTGYPAIYPANSELGRLLSKAFYDSKEKGWLNVENMTKPEEEIFAPEKCDKACEEVSFQSWALTSAMGVDSCTCRKYQIWTLCTPELMKKADPQLYAALTQDIKKPTGNYRSKAVVY